MTAKGKTKQPRAKKPKVARADLSRIALAAAEAMRVSGAFTQCGLALDRAGKGVGVFTDAAVQCDALGWILKKAQEILALPEKKTQRAYWASELINEEIVLLTGRTLVTVSDEDGREVIAGLLTKVATNLAKPV
jgi:hypothetical protein